MFALLKNYDEKNSNDACRVAAPAFGRGGYERRD